MMFVIWGKYSEEVLLFLPLIQHLCVIGVSYPLMCLIHGMHVSTESNLKDTKTRMKQLLD